MSRVWLTSDLHVGHEFIARMRTGWIGYPSEWMGAVDWHDAYLGQQWDSVVGEDDQVWVLGDISSGTKNAQIAALEWLSQRPGTKYLIAGNHDGPFPHHRDAHKWLRPYLQVFESVAFAARRRIPLVQGHTDVWFSHLPYTDEHTAIGSRGRYPDLRLTDTGSPIVHGHTHSTEKVSGSDRLIVFDDPHPGGTLQLHVGVDAWNGALVPLEWITAQVQAWVGVSVPPERERASQP